MMLSDDASMSTERNGDFAQAGRNERQAPVPKLILLVEDDPATAEALQLVLTTETPYVVRVLSSPKEVLLLLETLVPDLMVLDQVLPEQNGLALYDQLHHQTPFQEVPVILMGASVHLIRQQVQERGLRILEKPFSVHLFLHTIEEALGPAEGGLFSIEA